VPGGRGVVGDAGEPGRGALAFAEAIVDVAIDEGGLLVVRADVGVLADEECAVGVGEEGAHVAGNPLRIREHGAIAAAPRSPTSMRAMSIPRVCLSPCIHAAL